VPEIATRHARRGEETVIVVLQFDVSPRKLLDAGLAYDFRRSVDGSAVSREVLNSRILLIRVDLFSPSLAAAPFRPPTTQFFGPHGDVLDPDCTLLIRRFERR
jgi:hypothetical protein